MRTPQDIRSKAAQKVQKWLEKAERKVQRWQGKGFGETSFDSEVEAMKRLLPPQGAIVLDVGANKGLWTLELLRQASNQVSEIHAFEPSSHNLPALDAIADTRLKVVRSALGASRGAATLFYDKPGSGLASLSRRDVDWAGISMDGEETVPVTTLDDYLIECGIKTVDFAKFDIEGHELAAFRGAENALRSGVIKALSFEFGGANIDTRTFFKDFYGMLVPMGFRLSRINPHRRPTEVTKYSEGLEVFTTTNYIAVFNSAV